MLIEFSVPQAEVFMSNAKSIAAVAGFGAGKTEVAMHRLCATMFEYPGSNMLYMAPTFPLIRDIWYPKIENFLNSLNVKYHINKSENIIDLNGIGKIFCRTMEHPARIVGFEVLDAFLDELDILPVDKALEVWRKAKARCRQKAKKSNQMYITTTPEGYKATYQLFKKEPVEGSHLVQMSTYSNLHNLPDDYIDELKANYPSQLIQAYIDGVFVNLTTGSVYYEFDRARSVEDAQVKNKEQLFIGNDFNVTKMAAAIAVKRDDSLHIIDEIVNGRDTRDMIDIIKDRYPGHPVISCPDAAGNSRSTSGDLSITDHSLLRNAGFMVLVKGQNPRIRDRISNINLRLSQNRLRINSNCHWLISCLEEMAYTKDGMPDKRNDQDHITDALGYLLWQIMPSVERSAGTWGARPVRIAVG